jgi:hypothetical protein
MPGSRLILFSDAASKVVTIVLTDDLELHGRYCLVKLGPVRCHPPSMESQTEGGMSGL